MSALRNRLGLIGLLICVLTLAACGLHWWQVEESHRILREETVAQTEKRASQLANAVAEQMGAIARSADFALLQLREAYLRGGPGFEVAVQSVLNSFPDGALIHVAVVGNDGYVAYSSLGLPADRTFVGDREHIRVHLRGGDRLHVSEPIQGRVSRSWSFLFTRPIRRVGEFAGVAIVSMSPEYISRELAKLALSTNDVVALMHPGGGYLGHSIDWKRAAGKSVAKDRPYLGPDAPARGMIHAPASLDPTPRVIAWSRVEAGGLIAGVGLDENAALQALDVMHRDGRRSAVAVVLVLLLFGGGTCALLLNAADRQERLQQSETKYSRLYGSMTDAYVRVDMKGRILEANKSYQDMLGYSAEELLGLTYMDVSTPIWLEKQRQSMLDQVRERGFSDLYEKDYVRKDGSVFTAEVRAYLIRNPAGRAEGAWAIVRDISERKRAERELREERNFSRAILDQAGALVVVLDSEGRIRRFNRAAEQLSGFRPEEVEGRFPWETLLPPEDADRVREEAFKALAGNPERLRGIYTNHWLTRTGTRRLIEWVNTLLLDESGRTEFMVSLGVDITERNAVEERLRKSEARLRQAQGIARLGNWELDLVSGQLWWSDEVFRLFEMDPAQFGASYEAFLGCIHPDDRDQVRKAYSRSLEDRSPYRITHRLLMPDGRLKFVEERCETDFAPDGTPLRSLGTVQDVTEGTLAGESLQRLVREKETLLREIHHRVKNNLQIVSSLLYFQSKKVRQPGTLRVFEELRQRLRSMILVHEKLYNSGNLAEVNFADYVHSLVQQLAHSAGEAGSRIRFIPAVGALQLPIAEALPSGMMLTELVTNVIKYAFPGERRGEASIEVSEARGRVSIVVSDNGVGLPEGFDPHTTVSFGWQLIRALVSQLDGKFEVEGRPGTRVSITFPHHGGVSARLPRQAVGGA